MMRLRICLFPLVLLAVVLAGCKIDSTNPISALDGAQPDASLYGVWRYQAKGDLVYVHIGPEFSLPSGGAAAAPAEGTRIILVEHKRNGITDDAYLAYPSRVGKRRYLNVVQSEGGKTVGFIFVRYALVDGNTLRFSTVDEAALRAAIKGGQIKGTTRGEGLSSETVITAEPDDIQRLLARDGETLFANPFVLKRVR